MAFRREKRDRQQAARGRAAETPTEIPAKGWKDILLRVKSEIGEDHVGLIAAGVAFYGLLALFPGIGALMAIAGLVLDPQTVVEQIDALGEVLPPEAASIVVGQASDVASSEGGGLGVAAIVGLLLALWSASAAMRSMMEGLNVAYDEDETRGFIKATFVRLLLTLGVIAGLILIFAIAVVVPVFLAFVPLGGAAEVAVDVARWAAMFLIVAFGLAVLYRYGPSREDPEWKWVTPGALAATVVWLVASGAFAFYVANFASYNETFGALGGVIILLMWMWISAYVILMGAELDAEMEAQTSRDTTTGPDQPIGQRGAVKADRLGPPKS